MQATIRLNNSILGWILVPSYSHPDPDGQVATALGLLYGTNWLAMEPSDRFFMKGEPVDKVVAHIKEVCKDLKMGVSFCGNRNHPIVRLWWKPVMVANPTKINVDLKWSCWSQDQSTWDEYAPGVWHKMQEAFLGRTASVMVCSSPRKECQYGWVTISKGEAVGAFAAEWDELESLADTLDTVNDDAFAETIPHSIALECPGIDWDFKVKARVFARLMQRIDYEESKCLVRSHEEWKFFEQIFRKDNNE